MVRSLKRVSFVVAAAVVCALSSASSASATFSGSNGLIVYCSAGGVSVAGSDGSDAHQIAALEGCSYPRWSPDGTSIVVVGRSGRQSQLVTMDADGGNQVIVKRARLGDTSGSQFIDASFTADGQHLLFDVLEGTGDTYAIKRSLLGGTATRTLYGPVADELSHASASDNGKMITFSRNHTAIWLMTAAGGSAHLVTDTTGFDPGSEVYSPDFKPGSKRIIYTLHYFYNANPVDRAFSVTLDGTGFNPLTSGQNPVLDAQSSPDGAYLIETELVAPDRHPSLAWSLQSHNGETAISVPGYVGMPSWQPLPPA